MLKRNSIIHMLQGKWGAVVASAALCLPAPAGAQVRGVPLSLEAAIEKALLQNPSVSVAKEAQTISQSRQSQAVARFLPRLDYIESFNRSNNPVFVFGSLLNQGRFTEDNFDIDKLNNPDPLNNFRSQFVLQQPIFIGGRNYLGREGASLGVELAEAGKKMADMQVIFETLRTYYGVQVSAENLKVMQEAVATAEEDLRRAQALYDSGMVTEADLLAIRVHLADLRQQQIGADNVLQVMKAELNHTLGEPLESEFRLMTPLSFEERPEESRSIDELESVAMEKQPAALMKGLEVESMRLERKKARSAFLPTVSLNAGWESDRRSFLGDGGTNWLLGFSLHMNLFNGLGDSARDKEAAAGLRKAEAEKKRADDEIRLEVRRAYLDRAAASERESVAREAVAQARESYRITEARYEGGLANVTELLRSQNALVGVEAGYLGAVYAGRLAEARLELATGSLHKESEAVKR